MPVASFRAREAAFLAAEVERSSQRALPARDAQAGKSRQLRALILMSLPSRPSSGPGKRRRERMGLMTVLNQRMGQRMTIGGMAKRHHVKSRMPGRMMFCGCVCCVCVRACLRCASAFLCFNCRAFQGGGRRDSVSCVRAASNR